MAHTADLWLYFLLVGGVILLPGTDMTYVLASALTGGRRGGFAATFGIITGAVFHMGAAVLGLGMLLKLYPIAFKLLLLAGTAFIAWIGINIFRKAVVLRVHPDMPVRKPMAAYLQGAIANLLNPAAYLFTLAVIPQFMRPDYGPLWFQGMVLWCIGSCCELAVYGTVTLLAAQIRRRLERDAVAMVRVSRVVGLLLLSVAMLSAARTLRGLG
ncbi:MAG TPA: LysE family translocator [Gammaproteobacteria bacterium]|nr:LysE family translocator [Gammaproteobacteria bacterium]